MPSGWSMMWVVCTFDLPVVTKKQQREAANFRKTLLERGYSMKQYSIYVKPAGNLQQAKAMTRSLREFFPESGHVVFYYITDRQMLLCDEFKSTRHSENDEEKREAEHYLFDF